MEHENQNPDAQRSLTWAELEAQNPAASAPGDFGAPVENPEPASFADSVSDHPIDPATNAGTEMFAATPTDTFSDGPAATFAAPAASDGANTGSGEVFDLLDTKPEKSSKMKTLVAAGLAVVVLGAGSMVAMKQFQSSDGTGGTGAGSPEAVVEQFFGSLSQEDFLGAAEAMEPTERRTMVNPGIEMMGELQRLGIVADDMDLGGVSGIDMQFDNMVYTPQSLGGNGDVVRVKVDGTFTGSGDASALPYGSLITDNLSAEDLAQLTAEGETAMESSVESIEDLGVVAVQRDGEWYVSLWYSIAEGIRRDSGVEGLPAFGNGPAATGGESPEDAVWALANAVENFSAGEMIGALDPLEAAALYDYSSLFLPEAQAALDSEFGDDVSIEFSRIDMRSEVDGDDGQVWLEGVAVEFKGDGEHIKLDTEADCVVENLGTGDCEVSSADGEEMGLTAALAPSSAMRVRNVDGRWYLSPMASVMQPMLDSVRGLERQQLQGWIDNPDSIFEEDGPLGAFGLLPAVFLGSGVSQGFEEVTSVIDAGEGEWVDPNEWEDFEEFEEQLNATTTTVVEDGVLPDTTTSVPEFTFDTPLPGTDTTIPVTTIPDTTVPETSITTTTAAPTSTDLVVIFKVIEAAPAGTSAYGVLAEPVEVSPEEAARYDGALTEAQGATIEGWITLVDVEPGDILRYEWFAQQ